MARKHSEKGTEKHLDSQCSTSTAERVKKERILLERDSEWSKTGGKKGVKGQERGGKGHIRVCWSCGKTGHIAVKCTKETWNKSLNAVEDK